MVGTLASPLDPFRLAFMRDAEQDGVDELDDVILNTGFLNLGPKLAKCGMRKLLNYE
jgi:hypothetical protein